ncbi:hypothetical protein HUT37_15750 [Bacteroides sartorii]|nr:hypothetical protein [Phocaeicola sartorii]
MTASDQLIYNVYDEKVIVLMLNYPCYSCMWQG